MSVIKHRKIISFIMIIVMLVFGMCFSNNVESYSFFVCNNVTVADGSVTAGEFFDNTVITSDICASSIRETYMHEMPNQQALISGVARRYARNSVRIFRNEVQALCFISTCLLLFLYFMLWEFCPNLHKIYNNIVVVSYIHQKDGKKVYSF